MDRIETITLLGKPGCGKGTQSALIKNIHPDTTECISTGDIYRGAKTPDGIYGQFFPRIQPYIDSVDNKGKLVPNEVMIPIVGEILQIKVQRGISRFIFDGFPRNIGQLEEFDKIIQQYDFKNYYIYYKIFDKIALQRVEYRRHQAITNHQLIRKDDQPITAKIRLNVFCRETKPMIDKLKSENRLTIIKAYRSIQDVAEITRRNLTD
jgi:adenylate kinase